MIVQHLDLTVSRQSPIKMCTCIVRNNGKFHLGRAIYIIVHVGGDEKR